MTYRERVVQWAEWTRIYVPGVCDGEYNRLLEWHGDDTTLHKLAMDYWVAVSKAALQVSIKYWVKPPPHPGGVTTTILREWLAKVVPRVSAVPDTDPRDWQKFCLLLWDVLDNLSPKGEFVSTPTMEHVSDLCFRAEMILDEPVEMPHE